MKFNAEIVFGGALTACVVLSLVFSGLIPAETFDRYIIPAMMTGTVTVALAGAWITFRHTSGLRFRKMWGYTLLVWGVVDAAYILLYAAVPKEVMDMGAYNLTTLELLLGNILGWVLLLYPTESLRPGWLTWKNVLWQLLPMFVMVAIDYLFPLNLQPIIVLYPVLLIILLFTHLHAYKNWCEENYSTLDDIEVEWIIRYLVMAVLVGVVYMYICLTHSPARGFTQLWLTIFMFVYSTEQILFRKDPWKMLRHLEKEKPLETYGRPNAELRKRLELWMEQDKPYLNPDFQLSDLCKALAMNRTYMSQFIHSEYNCTFYQFVNHYRVEEAKSLKRECPSMKVHDVSARCGFSSPTVFSRTFASFEGVTPREWARKINSE